MKKKLLVLLKSPYKFNTNHFFLGRWCIPFKYENKKTINNCSNYHWNNEKKKKKDAIYLNKFYEKVLNKLSFKLNKIHNINFSKKQWRLIIGFWLMNFITKSFDSYENLNFFLKNNKKKFFVDFFSIKLESIISKDYSDYTLNYINHFTYNQYLYQDLISQCFYNNFTINKTKSVKNNLGSLNINTHSKSSPLKLFIKKIINKLNLFQKKIFFEFDYIDPFFKRKLMWMLKIIPNYNFPFYNFKKTKISKNKRQFNLNILSKKKFENFVNRNAFKYIPYSYLENFKNIYNDSLKINLNSKKIFSTGSYIANDFFKIWLSTRMKKKAKFYIMYHGGGIPMYNHLSNHDEKISNRVISWHKPMNNKQIQLLNLCLKNKLNNRKKSYILITLEPAYYYPVRFFAGNPVSSQFIQDYEEKRKFAKKILMQGQKVKIRPHNGKVWDLKKRIEKNLGVGCYDNSLKLINSLENSKFHISGYLSTTFSESINVNIPTIGFINQKGQHYNHKFNDLIKLFYDNNLLFYDSKDLFKFIKKNDYDLDDWWNSKKIQDIVNIYKKDVLGTKCKTFNGWRKLLLKP